MRSYMSTYYFDTQDAIDYGVEKAVILYNLCFWIKHNKANGKHLHDGMYWTYNSAKAFKELFPFWSQQKIARLLRQMEQDGLIKSANFNKVGFDKTKVVHQGSCFNELKIMPVYAFKFSQPFCRLNHIKGMFYAMIGKVFMQVIGQFIQHEIFNNFKIHNVQIMRNVKI